MRGDIVFRWLGRRPTAQHAGDGHEGEVPVLERWDAVRVGGMWHQVFALMPPDEVWVGYARELLLRDKLALRGRSAWLAVEVSPGSFHFGWAARQRLKRIEMNLGAEAARAGALVDPRETGAATALREIYDAGSRGEPLARWRLWAGVMAPSLPEVRQAGRELTAAAEMAGFRCRLLWARQWPSLRRFWPGVSPLLDATRGRLSPLTAAAGLVPAVGGGTGDRRGIYAGHRLADGRLVCLDIFSGTGDSNIVVLGKTGSGKSTFLKALIQSLLQAGCRTVVMDLDGEGRAQCEALGGVWMDLTAATGRYIDPLILPPPVGVPDWLPPADAAAVRAWNASRLALAAETVKGFVSILAGEYWTPETSAVTHRALLAALAGRGIDPADPGTWGRGSTMGGWWAALKELSARGRGGGEATAAARRLVYLLGPYFEGDLALFREPVAIAEADAIWLHLASAMSQGTDRIAATAKMALALTTLWAVTVQERVRGQRYTGLCFDEGQRLLGNAAAATTLKELVTGVRKYNALTVLATNMPAVFWQTDGGKAAWQNSSYRVLFGLEDDGRRELMDAAPGDDGAGIPRRVLARLGDFGHKGTDLEHAYLIRHPVRGWDECILKLPPGELDLYKTRGLRPTVRGE